MRFVSNLAIIVGAVLAAGLAADGPALAQGGACQSLQQQYVAALRGGASNAIAASDPAALSRSLAAAQQSANANHCSSFGIFSPPPTTACPAIRDEINRLQSSLRRTGGGGGFGGLFGYASYAPSPTEQLRDALINNGCGIPDPTASGSRTLCVRTCDGYYFPVSASTGGGGFSADAQVCQATYGAGAATELFIGTMAGDMADARSLTGQRYGDKPYAFLYRTKFNPVCVAQLQDGVLALAGALPAIPASVANGVVPVFAGASLATAIVPVPQLRPRMSEDPETLANAAGSLRPQPVVHQAVASGVAAGMRVVGAGYYNLMLEQQPGAIPLPASLVTARPSAVR